MPRRTEAWVRQRAEQVEVGLARQALDAVVPARSKVGHWQAQAVRLRAIAARRRADGQPCTEIAEAASSMLADIEQERRALELKVSELPPEVAGHSRFQDVVKALASASEAMRSVLP
jgi:hypothetical protein